MSWPELRDVDVQEKVDSWTYLVKENIKPLMTI